MDWDQCPDEVGKSYCYHSLIYIKYKVCILHTSPFFTGLESAALKVDIATVRSHAAATQGLTTICVLHFDVISRQANKQGLIGELISAEYKQVSLFC